MEALLALIDSITTEVAQNADLAWIFVGISLITFIGSLILIPWLIVRLPEDYFSGSRRHKSRLKMQHPVVYWSARVAKNALSLILIVAGIAMLVLPGQGLLSILIGISISDFPGKYHLERYLVSRPGVLKSINWIRKRAGKPSLSMDSQGGAI